LKGKGAALVLVLAKRALGVAGTCLVEALAYAAAARHDRRVPGDITFVEEAFQKPVEGSWPERRGLHELVAVTESLLIEQDLQEPDLLRRGDARSLSLARGA
jgi:hypothetical protein